MFLHNFSLCIYIIYNLYNIREIKEIYKKINVLINCFSNIVKK